jgi:DNA ligase (NAD+)
VGKYHDRLQEQRDRLPFEIDGVVIKLDDLTLARKLGTRHRSPRGALAWKFVPREEVTVLEDIVVQVGKSGALTPVALLSPVDVGGVTISRATLHNERDIHRKDLRLGDKVRIMRAGDVIPEVVERVGTPGRSRGRRFSMPKKCPACGTKVVQEEAISYCPAGIACRGQLVCCLRHFASREALDIEGLGVKTARQLVERGLVKDIADLYRLRAEDLESLEGFAAGSANKLYQAIQAARRPRLDRFLYGMAIRHVGRRTASLLAQEFGSLRSVRGAREEQIAGVAGPAVARSVREFFDDAANKRVLGRLEKSGVRVQDMPARKAGGKLTGKTFVFTGTMSAMTREEAKEAVEALGGRAASSVSRNTDYLVAGVDPGSKLMDARRAGVKIVNESQFQKLRRA